MTMAITSFVVSALSVAYSYYQAEQMKAKAERARREAEENADLRKGLQTVVDCKAAPLAIYYGKNKAGGARVYHSVSSNYTYVPEPNAQVFEAKKPEDDSVACWELKNTKADWSGTWSLNPSNRDAIREIANAWITTKEDPSQWKRPNRKWVWGGIIINEVPKVNYVFLRGNENQVPTKQLSAMGFNFPEVPGVKFVMDKNINGEKREFLFFQQALSHGGISDIVAIDVDSRPLSYESYQKGARIHAFKHGGVSDALMTANRFERNTAKFPKIAYLSCYFRLNRDDPQYGGVPTVQSYLFGNQVAPVIKGGFLFSPAAPYSLGSPEYSNNAALVLLDYLLSKDYGRGLNLSEIDLESFYRASKVCGIVIKKVPVMGKIYQNQTGTRDLILYDFNSGVDSNQPMRGNIQKILDSMPYSALVWSDGKYKLNLPYAFLWSATQVFHPDDIVYVVDGHPKLFRAVETNINKNPLSSAVWVEDVLPQKFKNLSDEDLVNSNDITVTWPDSNSKLNFVTVRFLNEAKDFEEDTASWPDKEPRDGSNVYATYLAEDKNRKLESEVSAEHICDMYHALAYAEQQVRRSRDSLSISAKFTAIAFGLEAGDLFGFSSAILNIPYAIYRVESTENSDGGVIAINAVTFDANLLAWNVDDNKVSEVVNVFQSNNLKQARNLSITAAVLANKSSGYRLSWEKSGDASVNTYLVKYATESFENIDENTNWTEVGEFSNTFCDLPPLSGTFVFTVVSKGANGKTAPFHSLAGGSEWPMLQADLTADHLAGNSAITMVLSNEAHVIPADTGGTVLNGGYYGSGTDVQIVQGSEQLTYDPNIVGAGYYKVTVTASGITEGTLSVHNFNARLGDSTSMTTDNATITILAEGHTIDGTEFSLSKTQSVTKMRSGNSGDDAVLISLLTNANVIYKASSSALNSGTYTSIAISGKRTVGGVTAQYGVVTVKPDNGVESAKSANITYTPASTSGVSGVTLKLYDSADSSTVLDTQYIPVVFKGDTGSSPINASVSNPTVAIQCDATGTPTGYSNTSTAIYLYQGDVALAYDGVGIANGTWKVVAVGTSITPSVVVTDMGDYVNFGSHAGITADSASILYTITGKSTNGTALALTVKQTFTKILRGETVIGDGSITAAKLATGAIDSTKFASSIEPITIVNTQTLPTTKSTTQISWNGAIYEWNGTAYTNTVPTANLSGTITASQIANGILNETKFASGIEPIKVVSSLPAVKSTNNVTYNGELYTWNGSAYSKSVKATDVTGQLTDAQVATISAAKLTGQITATQITDNSITTAKIAAGTITADKIAANSITAAQIATGAVTAAAISANAVTANKIAANAVTATHIAADSITSAKIAAGAVNTDELAAGAITASKIAISDITNLYPDMDMIDSSFYTSAGTVTFVGTTSTPLGQNFLRLGGVATVSSGWFPVDPSADFYVTALAWVNAVAAGSSAVVGVNFGTLAADGTVTQSRSITLGTNAAAWNATSSKFVEDVTTTGSERRMRFWVQNIGSASDACAGGFRVQRKANGSLIVDGAVIASKIAAGAITADKIAAGAITADKIAANSITSAQIAAGAVNAQQIAAGAIGAEKLSIGSSQNLLPNPLFLNDFAGWTKSLGAFVRYVYPDGKVGVEVSGVACELRCDNFTTIPLIKVRAGDKLLCKITVEAATGNITVLTGLLGRVFYANGTTGAASILRIATLSQGLMQELSVEYTVPANVIGMSFYLNKGDAGNIVRLSDPVVARKTTGELLVDGSITASKIAADAVTADKINVTNLEAINANTGNLTATGAIYGGGYTTAHAGNNDTWPASGVTGFALSANGLKIGNKTDNKFIRITPDGNLYAPTWSSVNGKLTINELDVVDTRNIVNNAVTKAVSLYSGGSLNYSTFMSLSVSIDVPSKIIVFSFGVLTGEISVDIRINGSLVRTFSAKGSFSNVFFTNLSGGTYTVELLQDSGTGRTPIKERSLLILAVAK